MPNSTSIGGSKEGRLLGPIDYSPHPKDREGNIFSLFVSPHRGGGGGLPWPGQDGVGSPARDGVQLPPIHRWGTPTCPVMGCPLLPGIGQHIEYLICGGRYASCAGLSCLIFMQLGRKLAKITNAPPSGALLLGNPGST